MAYHRYIGMYVVCIINCPSLQVTFPPPPTNKKYLTFSHIFGTIISSLDTFLLERKVKGPCWLEIKEPEAVLAKVSWCKLEAACEKMENISVIRNDSDLEPPPVVIAAVSIQLNDSNYLQIKLEHSQLFHKMFFDFPSFMLMFQFFLQIKHEDHNGHKTRKTKILMLSCLTHNYFPIHKPPPNPPFQQHFCGEY